MFKGMKLSVIRGVPGSGKSTFARSRYRCLILENDMFHVSDGEYRWSADRMSAAVDWCAQTAEHALSRGMDVCVANTFVLKKYVEFYRRMAERYGADFEVVRCVGDLSWTNVHSVPYEVLASMRSRFEPYPGEAVAKFRDGSWRMSLSGHIIRHD